MPFRLLFRSRQTLDLFCTFPASHCPRLTAFKMQREITDKQILETEIVFWASTVLLFCLIVFQYYSNKKTLEIHTTETLWAIFTIAGLVLASLFGLGRKGQQEFYLFNGWRGACSLAIHTWVFSQATSFDVQSSNGNEDA